MVAQRKSLLAWTGSSLTVRPRVNSQLSIANWGNTYLTGRGLVALSGQGQIYQISLKPSEEFVVHPSNVVAYTITPSSPQPYRLKSSSLKLQVPALGFSGYVTQFLPETKFFKVMRESNFWKTVASILFKIRTWSRRTIWGDRLFLKFNGPTTILLQSRASRVSDVLTKNEVNEIADVEPGTVKDAVKLLEKNG
jgi:uncharacterized protein (AIM24 family)